MRRVLTAVCTHQLQHARAGEMAHEGVPLVVIQRHPADRTPVG